MRIIEQSFEILSFSAHPLQDIERAARTCYKSEDRITDGSSEKLVRSLISRGHTAMIEFGDATVKFITDRGVTHELVRHRLCSFAQESTRYVSYKDGAEFIRPVWWDKWDIEKRNLWEEAMVAADDLYRLLISVGASPQEARSVLPNSLKTEIVVKANFTEWRHIFKLRTAKAAHPQMRALMIPVMEEFQRRCPIIFDMSAQDV